MRKGFKFKDLIVKPQQVNTNEFNCLLWSIRDYKENVWFKFEADGSCLFFTSEVDLEPTTPLLLSFESHSSDQVEDLLDVQFLENKAEWNVDDYPKSITKIDASNCSAEQNYKDLVYDRWTVIELRAEIKRRKKVGRKLQRYGDRKGELIKTLLGDDAVEGGNIYLTTRYQIGTYEDTHP